MARRKPESPLCDLFLVHQSAVQEMKILGVIAGRLDPFAQRIRPSTRECARSHLLHSAHSINHFIAMNRFMFARCVLFPLHALLNTMLARYMDFWLFTSAFWQTSIILLLLKKARLSIFAEQTFPSRMRLEDHYHDLTFSTSTNNRSSWSQKTKAIGDCRFPAIEFPFLPTLKHSFFAWWSVN